MTVLLTHRRSNCAKASLYKKMTPQLLNVKLADYSFQSTIIQDTISDGSTIYTHKNVMRMRITEGSGNQTNDSTVDTPAQQLCEGVLVQKDDTAVAKRQTGWQSKAYIAT